MRIAMAGRGRSIAGWLAAAALASTLATQLAGCATNHPQQDTAVSDVVTPSDEPETRKRARIRLELASGYYAEGKTDIALDEIKQAIVIDPSFGDLYNLRGLVYMRLGDNRQAEASFQRALALNPRDANAHHNYGWLQCQLGRYPESYRSFEQALSHPLYPDKPKTLMAMGLCQARAGDRASAEKTLKRSYELDAGNPITGYNLARLLYMRGDFANAQFYIRRINNSELANAESLWLGIKVEQRLNETAAMNQLAEQLRKRFPESKERRSLDRKAFDE
jgi:type IV pilus assembly protein PilF